LSIEPGNPQAQQQLDKLRIQIIALSDTNVFNEEFKQKMLVSNGNLAIKPSPETFAINKATPKESVIERSSLQKCSKFDEALRECALVYKKGNNTSDKDIVQSSVAQQAWNDLQKLENELSIAKMTSISGKTRKISAKLSHKKNGYIKEGLVVKKTENLWNTLQEEEREACAKLKYIVRSKVNKS